MNVKCKVDQAAALARGINATTSTVVLDINPALYSERERAYLARAMIDGHDLTRYGLSDCEYEVRELLNSPRDECRALSLPSPDEEGLREALRGALARWDAAQERAREKVEKKANEDRAAAARMADLQARLVGGALQIATPADLGKEESLPSVSDEYVFVEIDGKKHWVDRIPALEPVIEAHRAKWFLARSERLEKIEAEKQATKLAREAREAKIAEIIDRLGLPADKERLKRGLMPDPSEFAEDLLAREVFDKIDMSPAQLPDAEDLDLGEYGECDEENLPKIIRDCELAESLTTEEMSSVMGVEEQVKKSLPDAEIDVVKNRLTRDASDIPWISQLAVRVTVMREGFSLSKQFAI